MKITILQILILMIAAPAFADELDLRQWDDLSVLAKQHQREQERNQSFLPPTLQPTKTQNGLIQQVLTYNVDQLKAAHPAATNVVNHLENSSVTNSSSAMTIQMQPINTRATIDFKDQMQASIVYQPWSHQTELRVRPDISFHGLKLEFSHINSPNDQQNRILLTLAW